MIVIGASIDLLYTSDAIAASCTSGNVLYAGSDFLVVVGTLSYVIPMLQFVRGLYVTSLACQYGCSGILVNCQVEMFTVGVLC